jgi:hypothetical protein
MAVMKKRENIKKQMPTGPAQNGYPGGHFTVPAVHHKLPSFWAL